MPGDITTNSPLEVGQVDVDAPDFNNLVNDSVINPKAVTEDKLGDQSVSNQKIKPGAVNTDQMADQAATFSKIQNIDTTKVIGRKTAGAGSMEELDPTTDLLPMLGLKTLATSGLFKDLIDAPAFINGGKLTFSSGSPDMTSNITAATTLYWTPASDNYVSLYDGTHYGAYSLTEKNISLSTLTAGLPADVFAYVNSGVPTLELLNWSSATTRSVALSISNGIKVKSTDTTRRYLGTVCGNDVGGQSEWLIGGGFATGGAKVSLLLYNEYNRSEVSVFTGDTTSQWTWNSTARVMNGAYNTHYHRFVSGESSNLSRVYRGSDILTYRRSGSADNNLVVGVGYKNGTPTSTTDFSFGGKTLGCFVDGVNIGSGNGGTVEGWTDSFMSKIAINGLISLMPIEASIDGSSTGTLCGGDNFGKTDTLTTNTNRNIFKSKFYL